jgi:hypothetical protein
MFQDKMSKELVSFIAFKLPFKIAKYFVIIVIIRLVFSFVFDMIQAPYSYPNSTPWCTMYNDPHYDKAYKMFKSWDN